MMVLKERSGKTANGNDYSIVVAKTSKPILPAKQTSFASFVSSSTMNATQKSIRSPRTNLWVWIEQLIGSK